MVSYASTPSLAPTSPAAAACPVLNLWVLAKHRGPTAKAQVERASRGETRPITLYFFFLLACLFYSPRLYCALSNHDSNRWGDQEGYQNATADGTTQLDV